MIAFNGCFKNGTLADNIGLRPRAQAGNHSTGRVAVTNGYSHRMLC